MKKLALCVGINSYPDPRAALAGCVNDALDWRGALIERGFDVEVLLDNQATKAFMVAAIERLVHGLRDGDLGVFTFSGHGSQILDVNGDEPDVLDEVICPWDILSDQPLSDDELASLFAQRERGARLVLVADCCHSGTLVRGLPPPPPVPAKEIARPRLMPPDLFGPATYRPPPAVFAREFPLKVPVARPGQDALLLAGCQDSELSYDATFAGRPNGAFSHAAIAALQTLDAEATYTTWFQAIHRTLPSLTYQQTPNLLCSREQRRWRVLA